MWIMTNDDFYRGLEGTGIYMWRPEHTEHVASLASELGDSDVESMCDAVLAGDESEELVIDLLDRDDRYRTWLERGRNLGLRQRAEVS